MFVDPTIDRALERIAQRGADVQRAFTPGAVPNRGDDGGAAEARPSLDPLDVAPPADAYFVTTDERGRSVYTRDGGCTLRDGVLDGSNGRPLLGIAAKGGALVPIRIDPVDLALGRVHDLRIDPEGRVCYERTSIDPRTGGTIRERVTAGQLALARFPAATAFTATDASHVSPPPGVVPHLGRAGDGTFSPLRPMARETSGISIDRSLDRLREAYLALDALQVAQQTHFHVAKTTMDLLK